MNEPMYHLLQFTQPGLIDVADGQPTPCFIEPRAITLVTRVRMRPNGSEGTIECTMIHCGPLHFAVTESPAVVAQRRNRALGLPSVVAA